MIQKEICDLRILFMGTPDYALEILKGLYGTENEIIGVVTQPDKPKGRGHKMTEPPVKVFATEFNIPVYQPTTLKDGAFSEELERLSPDMIIVAAYGKILPRYILDYPKFGCINAHASLLPKYRGAAPIQRAIMDGESESGVCSMYMEDGIDTGDVIFTEKVEILPDDDYSALHDKLAKAATNVILRTVGEASRGILPRTKQDESLMIYAAKITKDDRILDFEKSALEVYNKIRALSPFPRAISYMPNGMTLQITSAVLSNEKGEVAGEVISFDSEGFTVSCKDSSIKVLTVIPEGKGNMSGADLIRGRKLSVGDVLSGVKNGK